MDESLNPNIGYIKPFLNLTIRALTMMCKFLLVIFLAKILSPSQIGLFGLFSATLVFCQLIIGGEFYTYSQRELIFAGKKNYSFVLQHQAISLSLLYIILIPALSSIFIFDFLPMHLIKWFFLILVFESIAQELNRILIAMEYQLLASMILFFRHGSWVLFAIPFMFYYPAFQTLELVFISWLIGSILAVIFGILAIKIIISHWQLWRIDNVWIIKGLKVSLLFFVGAVCFRGLFTLDRFSVESLAGIDFLGVYVVYIGIAMSLVTVLDPLIFSFLYPKLINSIRNTDSLQFNKIMRYLFVATIIVSSAALLFIFVLSPYIFSWLDKSIYLENLNVFRLLLAASFAYAMSMIPHFGLYAMKKDSILMKIHFAGFMVFLAFLFILPLILSKYQVAAASLLISFLTIGFLKLYFLIKYKNLNTI